MYDMVLSYNMIDAYRRSGPERIYGRAKKARLYSPFSWRTAASAHEAALHRRSWTVNILSATCLHSTALASCGEDLENINESILIHNIEILNRTALVGDKSSEQPRGLQR